MRNEEQLRTEENLDSFTTNTLLLTEDWLVINNAKFKGLKTIKVYFLLKQDSNMDIPAALLSATVQGFRLLLPCGSVFLQVLPIQPKDGGSNEKSWWRDLMGQPGYHCCLYISSQNLVTLLHQNARCS